MDVARDIARQMHVVIAPLGRIQAGIIATVAPQNMVLGSVEIHRAIIA